MFKRWCAPWLLYLAVSQVLAGEVEPKTLVTSTVGDTSIEVSKVEPQSEQDVDEQIVTLTRKGSQPITLDNVYFDVLYTDPDPTHAPNMIVRGRSGGANCCATLHIVSFSPSLHKQDIEAFNADPINVQVQASGGPTLNFVDTNFVGWNHSIGGSPVPPISLVWDAVQGRYALDVDGMRKPAPSNIELEDDAKALLTKAVDTNDSWPPTLLWADMLKYIYSGNSASARTLMDTAWQPGWGDRELFFSCFSQRLQTGSLWNQMDIGNLLKANGDFPEPISKPADCN